MILFVDVEAILNTSALGKASALRLQKEYEKHTKVRLTVAEKDRPKYDHEATVALEKERSRLREDVLDQAKIAAETLRVAKKADAVMPKGVALAFEPSLDVTAEIMKLLER